MTEVIEGEAVEVPARALVVSQPGQVIVSDAGPDDMLTRASAIATALARMVDAQNLYTLIRGKKYPNVEAWQTIGRMDNVVAREASRPVRNDDGSWEAFVELVRLSDGMVIGNGSALCGAERDGDWTKRPDHEKRSMAVTRATSRAFRQQYSWIMALAGYEPTPSDEMPKDGQAASGTDDSGLIGTASIGKAGARTDFELRQTPEGWHIGFRLGDGGKGFAVYALGPLAEALHVIRDEVIDQRVTCWGTWRPETFRPKGAKQDVTYQVLHLDKIQTANYVLPADTTVGGVDEPAEPEVSEPEASEQSGSEATLGLTEEEKALVGGGLPEVAA